MGTVAVALAVLAQSPAPESGVDPTVTIVLAALGFLGVTVAPIAIALINRGGKSKSLELPPEVAMPRTEYDELVERLADLDTVNARLARENDRLEHELKDEQVRRLKAELRAEQLEKGTA